jgi:hypothetical protein
VDVGGGRGELLQKVLRAHGHLRGTLFDQPAVVAPVAVPTCSSTSSTTGAMRPACGSWPRSAPGNNPFPGKLLDLNMLVMTEGGRERSPAEYAILLSRAGFTLQRIVPTASPVSVVEAMAG